MWSLRKHLFTPQQVVTDMVATTELVLVDHNSMVDHDSEVVVATSGRGRAIPGFYCHHDHISLLLNVDHINHGLNMWSLLSPFGDQVSVLGL